MPKPLRWVFLCIAAFMQPRGPAGCILSLSFHVCFGFVSYKTETKACLKRTFCFLGQASILAGNLSETKSGGNFNYCYSFLFQNELQGQYCHMWLCAIRHADCCLQKPKMLGQRLDILMSLACSQHLLQFPFAHPDDSSHLCCCILQGSITKRLPGLEK